jgi:hypothetical protein
MNDFDIHFVGALQSKIKRIYFFRPGIVIPDCGGLCYFEQLSIHFDSVEVGSVDLLHEHLK